MSAAPVGGQSTPAASPTYAINPWPIAFTVTIATFMEALDSSIANVALPHIAGSMSATANQATWVLTSYLVSNGINLPLGAWLSPVEEFQLCGCQRDDVRARPGALCGYGAVAAVPSKPGRVHRRVSRTRAVARRPGADSDDA